MKERKIKNKKYYNLEHHADQQTIFKWHDDLTLTWNINEIQTQFSKRVITNYAKHCQSRECIMQTEVLKSFQLSKNQTLFFLKNLCV